MWLNLSTRGEKAREVSEPTLPGYNRHTVIKQMLRDLQGRYSLRPIWQQYILSHIDARVLTYGVGAQIRAETRVRGDDDCTLVSLQMGVGLM